MPVTIRDARGKVDAPALDREGFQLVQRAERDAGFAEREADPARLLPGDGRTGALSASGARRAIVFDHLVRRRAPGTLSPFGAREGHRPSAATRVHCDFTPASARRRLAQEMEARGIGTSRASPSSTCGARRGCRCWTRRWPCATRAPCARRTSSRRYRLSDRTGEIFEVLYNPAHAWTYFHAMQFDEVLMFKQYDSADRHGLLYAARRVRASGHAGRHAAAREHRDPLPPHLRLKGYPHMNTIEFWFDFGSNYSYLSMMRIRRLAADAGVRGAC
jgi:hypothetical protein